MTRNIIRAAVTAALLTGFAFAQQHVLINATGATFPYPMYSKWFDSYHKKFPGVEIN